MHAAHRLLLATTLVALSACEAGPTLETGVHAKASFHTALQELPSGEQYLWVFEESDPAWPGFQDGTQPAAFATLLGAGPDQVSLRGPDLDVLVAYAESE